MQKLEANIWKVKYHPYICIVFHGIRFKVSKDWLS